MKHRFRKLAIASTLAAGIVGMVAPAAYAGNYLNSVGSDTTYFVMDALSRSYNVAALNTDLDVVVNTPPLISINDSDVVNKVFPGGQIVPSDANCSSTQIFANATVRAIAGITGVSGVTVAAPPNGSGAGKSAVLNSGNAVPANSCSDIGRSSSSPGVEAGTTEFWAFALDAVDWVRFAGNATPSLTKAQLQSIYNCDSVTKKPAVTDWNGIPGSGLTGPIKRYIAQSAAGTGQFFARYLNNSTTNLNTNCADGVDVQATPGDTTDYRAIVTQENDNRAIATADKARAIYYMSYGQWFAQSKSVLADLRNGAVLGAINVGGTLIKPSAATINTSPTRFPATRYLYNILDTRNPDYLRAAKFVGAGDFDANPATPVTNGWLCSNLGQKTIQLYGFVPLKKLADPGTGILSYCVKNAPALAL
ncbi:MAG: hypothetical protein ACKO72_10905 [Actinomycetes bacterium]